MMLRQYRLYSRTESMICWLEDNRVKFGDVITLKDSDDTKRQWVVGEVYEGVVNEKQLHGQSAADNWNKHNNI